MRALHSEAVLPTVDRRFTPSRDVEADLTGAPRLAFADLARALAILMMLQGHTLDVVLASDLRTGPAFYLWSFVRGLVSCVFLVLSGFVFSVATYRRWTDYRASRVAIVRRLGRLSCFLLLGYALHFPMAKIAHLSAMSDDRWRSFLIVDVLQCIAVMLAILQVLACVLRTPVRYTVAAAIACFAIIAVTPLMWRTDWASVVPLAIAAYLSPAIGSLFPLFPWGAYILLGAVIGALYVRAVALQRTREYHRMLLGGGLGMWMLGPVCARVPLQPFGETTFWETSPNLFLVRAGLVLLVIGALAHLSRFVSRDVFIVRAMARESLTIYAVHVCLVYGSVWNAGLRQHVGQTQMLWSAFAYVASICIAMMLLATAWHWCKRYQPRVALSIRIGTGSVLLSRLL